MRLLLSLMMGLCGLVLAACEEPDVRTQELTTPQQAEVLYRTWIQDSIGALTIQDAYRKFGHPSSSVDLGDLISVLWANESRSGVLVPMPGIGVVPGPIIEAPPHGWRLELLFDRQTKMLKDGRYRAW